MKQAEVLDAIRQRLEDVLSRQQEGLARTQGEALFRQDLMAAIELLGPEALLATDLGPAIERFRSMVDTAPDDEREEIRRDLRTLRQLELVPPDRHAPSGPEIVETIVSGNRTGNAAFFAEADSEGRPESALALALERGEGELVENGARISDWVARAGPSSMRLESLEGRDYTLRAASPSHAFPRKPDYFGKNAMGPIRVLRPESEVMVRTPGRPVTEPAWVALVLPGSGHTPLVDPVAGLTGAGDLALPALLDMLCTNYRDSIDHGCPGSVARWYLEPIAASLERLSGLEGVERLVSPENGPVLVNWTRWLPASFLAEKEFASAFEKCAPAFHCVIHGDLGLENIIVPRGEREPIAVIDTGCGRCGDYVYDMARLFSSVYGVPYLPKDTLRRWRAEPLDEQLQQLTYTLKRTDEQQILHDKLLTAIESQLYALADSFEDPNEKSAGRLRYVRARFLLALSRIFFGAADPGERREIGRQELSETRMLVAKGLIFLNLSFSYLFCGESRDFGGVLGPLAMRGEPRGWQRPRAGRRLASELTGTPSHNESRHL